MKNVFFLLAGFLAISASAMANDSIDACVTVMESAGQHISHEKAVMACTNDHLDPIAGVDAPQGTWRRELAEDVATAQSDEKSTNSGN